MRRLAAHYPPLVFLPQADMVRAPGDIFSFMQSNKIGEKVSLFWIAWAFVAEKAENFKLTDQIFTKGLKKQAEPRDLLQKRYQQFQRRMARHLINTQEAEADRAAAAAATSMTGSTSTSTRISEERSALSQLSKSRGTGTARTGGAISIHSGNSGGLGSQASQSNISNNSRSSISIGAATRLAAAAVSAPVVPARPAAASGLGNFQIFSDADPVDTPTSGLSTESVRAQSQPQPHSRQPPVPPSSSSFGIFCDDAPALAENPQWKELASQKAVVKENTGAATTWSSGGLENAATRHATGARGGSSASSSSTITSTSSARAAAPPAIAAFSIFSDEVASPVEAAAQLPARKHEGIKEHVGAAHDPLEHLRRDRDIRAPLAAAPPAPIAHGSARAPAPLHVPKPAPAPAAAAQPVVFPIFADDDGDGETAALESMMSEMGALDEEDGTINTRLAMGAINSMFASPPAEKAKPVSRSRVSTGASSFGSNNMRNSSGAFPAGPGLRLGSSSSSSTTTTARAVGIGSRMIAFSGSSSSNNASDVDDLSMIHDGNDHTSTTGFALNTPMARPSVRAPDSTFTIFQD